MRNETIALSDQGGCSPDEQLPSVSKQLPPTQAPPPQSLSDWQVLREHVADAPQMKWVGQSALATHGCGPQRRSAPQTRAMPQTASPVQPLMQAFVESQVHSGTSQIKLESGQSLSA